MKATPELRFKEFKGDWVKRNLSEVLTLVSRPIDMDDNSYYSLVTVKRRYEGIVPRGSFLGKDVKVKSQFLLKENDFLISKRQISHNSCGIVPKSLDGSIVSNEYSVFIPAKDNDVFYFNYFSNRPGVSRTFFLSSIGVHIEKMLFKVDDWLKWKFLFPPLPEQQKIASFLSAVDEKIQQLTRKKELLEQYKKGVMQQLFSGKLRFKDENGKAYSKWEEKRLGEVLEIGSGRDYKHLGQGDIPVFGTGGLMTMVDDFLYDGETVCIGRKGTIDKPMYHKGKIWTVDTLFYTHSFKNAIPKFVFYVFQLINWREHNEASGVPSLSKTTIEKLKFKFPSAEEQQKIASFLTALDAKIESVATQIAHTQTFKKGLLQQMFV